MLLRSFLDNAARVADKSYTPTTDDILRARLRTLGVEEYRMTMETGTITTPIHAGHAID